MDVNLKKYIKLSKKMVDQNDFLKIIVTNTVNRNQVNKKSAISANVFDAQIKQKFFQKKNINNEGYRMISFDIIQNCKIFSQNGSQMVPGRPTSKWQKLKYIQEKEEETTGGCRVTLNKLKARCVTKFPQFGYTSTREKSSWATNVREKLFELWKYRNVFTRINSQTKSAKYESQRKKERL